MIELVVDLSGQVRCLYGEAIDLAALGQLQIARASHVEPDELGSWWVDLVPVNGPKLGPYRLRSDALKAERFWLQENWLPQSHKFEI